MGDPQNAVSNKIQVERPYSDPQIFLGTSSFTASGWEGSFYPKGMKSTDYLGHYAKTFRTVEIDSTFYATPSAATVEGWYRRTPADFTFALKVPQIITHQKVLNVCDAEFDEFLERMELLKEKLGPLLLQFPLFNKFEFKAVDDFLARLDFFLKKMPQKFAGKFVVEIRNKGWIDERFLNALREHNVALALTDTSFVPRPWELKKPLDLITADFAYVRWLGNRKQIEMTTTTWDKTIVDRTDDLTHWVHLFREFVSHNLKVFAFANNHYAGHGPATVKMFWDLWEKK
jgi:uncharacterized protein YecE (DUF72 family)